jgi:transposase
MTVISRIGVDLAKNVIQIHAVDRTDHVVIRKAAWRVRQVYT